MIPNEENQAETQVSEESIEIDLVSKQSPYWSDLLTESQRQLIHVSVVLEHFPEAPIVGRNYLLLISKMAEMLNRTNESGVDILALYHPKGNDDTN